MEHTIAILGDDIRREASRADFLFDAVRNYAPHVLHDIEAELERSYPRAKHLASLEAER